MSDDVYNRVNNGVYNKASSTEALPKVAPTEDRFGKYKKALALALYYVDSENVYYDISARIDEMLKDEPTWMSLDHGTSRSYLQTEPTESLPKVLRTPELVSQIAIHASLIDDLVSKGPSEELYRELHKSDEILSGIDQRRVLLDYIRELQVKLTADSEQKDARNEK